MNTLNVFSASFQVHFPPYTAFVGEIMPGIIVSQDRVFRLLRNLNVNSASVPDQISNHLLKSFANVVSSYLTALFNMSLANHSLAYDWKTGKAVPIHKLQFKKYGIHLKTNLANQFFL